MSVKAERMGDPKTLHHHEAESIGEAEILVMVAGEQRKRAELVGLGYPNEVVLRDAF